MVGCAILLQSVPRSAPAAPYEQMEGTVKPRREAFDVVGFDDSR
jgi:hypothetical protein